MHDEDPDWEQTCTARQAEIERLLGPVGDMVFHALIPLHLGGSADVIPITSHQGGVAYCTADLTGGIGQPANDHWDEYELVICLREPSDWAPNLLARLATYTLETPLNPRETMDIGPALPQPTTIAAFLYMDYGSFKLFGRSAGLVLCLGITADELAACRKGQGQKVIERLIENEVFPFTDLTSSSSMGAA